MMKKELRVSPHRRMLGREEGIPWVWVTGGALVSVLLMIICLLGYIFSMGLSSLWPRDIYFFDAVTNESGEEVSYVGMYHRDSYLTAASVGTHQEPDEVPNLILYQANQDFAVPEFVYVSRRQLESAVKPREIWYVERLEWGPFVGRVKSLGKKDMKTMSQSTFALKSFAEFQAALALAHERREEWRAYQEDVIVPINHRLEKLRVELKKIRRQEAMGENVSQEWLERVLQETRKLTTAFEEKSVVLRKMQAEDESYTVTLEDIHGETKVIPVSSVVRAFQPNKLGFFGKIGVYAERLREFLMEEPREANTLGGVFPAIFGTVMMTLIMTIAVLPIGVMAAIYIREIAKQGVVVSVVRIAVGNLAGVPSIVYGIFGLGFFCYTIGATIDELFFQDKLPNPTFGTGGILWASLTLAILTLPVVIVSTEEALQAVPRSLREASYGCGATRLQTLLRIVIPKALPGIMTGLILAMARGMGEVAPLLVTGVVKLAPELPLDSFFPFVHLERSFMHLGFHIYDVGFQSRSAEVSRSMVFASTALLVGLVFVLNLIAIRVRSQLRKRFEGRGAF